MALSSGGQGLRRGRGPGGLEDFATGESGLDVAVEASLDGEEEECFDGAPGEEEEDVTLRSVEEDLDYDMYVVALTSDADAMEAVLVSMQASSVILALPAGRLKQKGGQKPLLRRLAATVAASDPGDGRLVLDGAPLSVDLGLFDLSVLPCIFSLAPGDRCFQFEDAGGFAGRPSGAALLEASKPLLARRLAAVPKRAAAKSGATGKLTLVNVSQSVNGLESQLSLVVEQMTALTSEMQAFHGQGPAQGAGGSSRSAGGRGTGASGCGGAAGAALTLQEREAEAAGISAEDLRKMRQLFGSGPSRLGEGPPVAAAARAGLIAAAEEEEEAAATGGESALEKIASILQLLTKGAVKGGSATDQALSAMGSSASGSSEHGGRRNAAARLALRRALASDPAHFSRRFDDSVSQAVRDFVTSSSVRVKGLEDEHERIPVRTYLEHRARLGTHRPTIFWMWQVGGIYECLSAGNFAEARGRCALLLVAGEQLSLDSGSTLLAQELLMEEPAPFASITARSGGFSDPLQPYPRTCDPRWSELCLGHLKELDEWGERRRRLQGGRKPREEAGEAAPGLGSKGLGKKGAKKKGERTEE
jgi:hypothetical protein